MTYSELFTPHHNSRNPSLFVSLNRAVNVVTAVTRYPPIDGHYRGRTAESPTASANNPSIQLLGEFPPAEHAGCRVGAGAGATPVFAAVIRHDTSLARMGSLVGRSRTCPSNFIANPNVIGIQNEFASKE
jgi:hypothetical protein